MLDMTTEELQQHRNCHMGNLRNLKARYNTLDSAAKARAERTMANLMEQVYAIDEALLTEGAA